jgi:hypothetical protein
MRRFTGNLSPEFNQSRETTNVTSTHIEAVPQTPSGIATTPLFDRSDGTFLKPGPSTTAEHCINFWNNVTIPDEIITQAEDVYSNRRTKEVEDGLEAQVMAWAQQWLLENPQPKKKADIDAWNARFAAEREPVLTRVREELEAERPMWLGSYDARQLVRAAQMYFHIPHPDKYLEENIKVRDHPIELFDEILTVEDIEAKYRLWSMHGALERVFEDTTQKDISSELRFLNRNIEVIRDEIMEGRRER